MPPLKHEDVTVWIVEDVEGYRLEIQELINRREGLCCTETFDSCEAVLTTLNMTRTPPRVVLMDIGLPGLSGIECTERFKRVSPSTEIIMLTVHEDNDTIFDAICAGATGYLLKGGREKIIEAVEASVQGGVVIDPSIARRVLRMFAKFAVPQWDYNLTEREKEVLQGLVDAKTKQQVADDLFIAFSTVDTHVRNVYQKLQVNSRTAAVLKADREGLLRSR